MNVRYPPGWLLLLGLWLPNTFAADIPTCLWVSSYQAGYAWEDGIEKGIRSKLGERCRLEIFRLDSKDNPQPSILKDKARQAHELIGRLKPAVIIASDDNASRYLIEPYYKDADIPVVFCGINWSADRYGYPYKNATGMVEHFPYRAAIDAVRRITGNGAKRGLFIGVDLLTAHINFDNLRARFQAAGITLESRFVSSQQEWEQAVRDGQAFDFIYPINNAGIPDWDMARAADFIRKANTRLSISSNHWMYPVSMVLVSKQAEEQGEWAAEVALAVLDGTPVSNIPVIGNQRWDLYLNRALLEAAGFSIPKDMQADAQPYQAEY